MKRRDFLRSSVPAVVLPTVINGFSVKAFGAESPLAQLLNGSTPNDHVLVIVQLSGGNDGLNTVIPYGNDIYYQQRKTIAITKPDIITLQDMQGLNPNISA